MVDSVRIVDLLSADNPFELVMKAYKPLLSGNTKGSDLVTKVCELLPLVDRFSEEMGLEHWILEVSTTDDEGIEVMLTHDRIELIALLVEDDEDYDVEDLQEMTGIDTYYTSSYQEFLAEEQNGKYLLHELRAWEMDSNFHTYAIDHVKFLLKRGFDIPPFGGRSEIAVEFSFDEEEIFIGCIDEEFDTFSANPDYNLPHSQFDPENPEESFELGIQSWSEFDEEDDSWEDDHLDEEEWTEEDDDADWDSELDDEWDPGFEDEE